MNNIFSRTFFRRPAKKEVGFTIIEIVVAMGIVSTLSAIAVPVGMKAHREAVIATVKSDVRSSVDTIMGPDGFSEESFMAGKAVTSDNSITLTLSGSGNGEVACVWGSHVFGENDVVSYYYSSDTGRLNEGTCLGADTQVITGYGTTNPSDFQDILTNTSDETTITPAAVQDTTIPTVETVTVSEQTNTGIANACENISNVLSGIVSTSISSNLCGTIVGVPAAPAATSPTATPSNTATDAEIAALVADAAKAKGKKYPVCHNPANGSYKLLSLPLSAVTNASWSAGTIIPPIAGKYDGKNWDTAGQKIFADKCS